MVTLLVSLLDIGAGSHGRVILPLLLQQNSQERWSSFSTMVLNEPLGEGQWIGADDRFRRRLRRGAAGTDVFTEPVICNQEQVYQCACSAEHCVSADNGNGSESCCFSKFRAETLEEGGISLVFYNTTADFYGPAFDRQLRAVLAKVVDDYCAIDGCDLPSPVTFQPQHIVVYAVGLTNATSDAFHGLLPSLETSILVLLPSTSMQQLTTDSSRSAQTDTLGPENSTGLSGQEGSPTAASTSGSLSPAVLSAELLYAMLNNQTAAMSRELGLSVSVTSAGILPTEDISTDIDDNDDNDDDDLSLSMGWLVFLSVAGSLFFMTCCISAAKAVRDRRKIKARNYTRKEERKQLTSIENAADSVVRNGVNKKKKRKKNGVPRKPVVTISEHVTEATVHNHGPETVTNGTTVVVEIEKPRNGVAGDSSLSITPVVNQNGGHANENGHVVPDSANGVVARTKNQNGLDSNNSENNANYKPRDEIVSSQPMEDATVQDSDPTRVAEGKSSDDRPNPDSDTVTDSTKEYKETAVDDSQTAAEGEKDSANTAADISNDNNNTTLPDEGAVANECEEITERSDRPVSIDIRGSESEPAKSPGEDNPAFEASSP